MDRFQVEQIIKKYLGIPYQHAGRDGKGLDWYTVLKNAIDHFVGGGVQQLQGGSATYLFCR